MEKIRTIIVDDEALARTLVRNFLSTEKEIEVIAECSDGFEALKAIQEQKPDLVLLDIQMPKITGLELLELLENPPIIVFATAYDQYAIKAFEMNALDYLMKPFSKDRLLKSVEKVKATLQNKQAYDQSIKSLQNNPLPQSEKLDRVVVKDGHKIQLIPCEDIMYLEAQDDYVMIYTTSHKHLKQQTMKHFEMNLNKDFVRTHRSYMVNIRYVNRLEHYEKESYRIVLANNATIPVSKSGYSALKDLLKI
jgi:two-component system LytT family response regulator